MMKKMLFFVLFLAFWGTVSVSSQVRIGGDSKPVSAAILDLNPDSVNDNATKGLALPRVALTDKSLSAPLPKHQKGIIVYNTTASGDLKEGVYFNYGNGWSFLQPDSIVVPADYEPIIFLRSPGFAYLGIDGSYQDTLLVELSMADKSNVKYQWYQRMDDGSSQIVPGATNDTLFVTKGSFGIVNDSETIYNLYCLAVNGYQYGISGQAGVVYGAGARLSNNKWLKVKSYNLGATEMSIAAMMAYVPNATSSGVGDANYDPTVYGDWYQWGRSADGHQNRKVQNSGTFPDSLTTPNGLALSALDNSTGQVISGSAVGKFIQRNGGTIYDWRQYPESPTNSQLAPANTWTWGDPVNGITANDPCRTAFGSPWRVPTQTEWTQIVNQNYGEWRDGPTNGYIIIPGGSATSSYKPAALFLPANGCRIRGQGAASGVGAYSYYWSSTPNTQYGYSVEITSGSVRSATQSTRSSGFAVRCVSE